MKDSNTFVFEFSIPRVIHGRVRHFQLGFYVRTGSIPVRIARKEQRQCIKPVFLISQFRKQRNIGKFPKAPIFYFSVELQLKYNIKVHTTKILDPMEPG